MTVTDTMACAPVTITGGTGSFGSTMVGHPAILVGLFAAGGIASAAAQYPPPAAVSVTVNVAGDVNGTINIIVGVRKGVPFPLGSVVNRRNLIHVDHLCKVILLCVDSDDAPGNTFHVRDLKNYCTQDIVASIARSLSRPIRIFPFPVTAPCAIPTSMGRQDQREQLTNWLQVHDSHAHDLLRYQPEELPIEAA